MDAAPVSFPGRLYQAQLTLTPNGLIAEFVVVCAVTLSVGIILRTKLSPVNWKRTDYFYYAMTVLAGAIGIADFSTSDLNREIQDMLVARSRMVTQIHSAASLFDSVCLADEREKELADEREKEQERLRETQREQDEQAGIIPPPDPSDPPLYGMLGDGMLGVGSGFQKRECSSAHDISNAFDEPTIDALIMKIGIAKEKTYVVSPNHVEKDRYTTSISEPAGYVVNLDAEVQRLRDRIEKLSFASLFRRLYPILFGLGFGVRLARTHYDVQTARQDLATKKSAQKIELNPPQYQDAAPGQSVIEL